MSPFVRIQIANKVVNSLKKVPSLIRGLAVICLLIMGGLYYLFNVQVTPSDEVLVLNYHQINNRDKNSLTVRPGIFADELDYLMANGYHVISLDQFISHQRDGAPLPDKPVLITFDDGYRDNYTEAFPLLKERNMPALIFIITDYVGTQKNYLTWPQIHEMEKQGISFGSHTLSHSKLSKDDPQDARFQLETSQAVFRWQFGKNARALAYPCGYYDDTVKQLVKAAGYDAAFTVDYGPVSPGDDLLSLRRVPIFGDLENETEHFRLRIERVPGLSLLYAVKSNLQDMGLSALADQIPIP